MTRLNGERYKNTPAIYVGRPFVSEGCKIQNH